MQESPQSVELFRTLLNPENPLSQAPAAKAMIAAARATCWRRNQPCDAVIARGAISCILGGAVRKFAVQPNGQRQIIDVTVTRDFLGFAPSDPAFALEAVSNDTRIATFTREQSSRSKNASPRFPH